MQQGKLDLDFYFDVGAMNAECHLPDTPHDYYFQDFDASFTQLIISERRLEGPFDFTCKLLEDICQL